MPGNSWPSGGNGTLMEHFQRRNIQPLYEGSLNHAMFCFLGYWFVRHLLWGHYILQALGY